MTKFEKFMRGYAVVTLCSAAPEYVLNRLSSERLPFWDVRLLDSVTVQLSVFYRDIRRFRHLAQKAQSEIMREEQHPGIWIVLSLLQRPFLAVSVLLSLALLFSLQNRIWYFTLSGNETVPRDAIIRALSDMGIGVGTKNDSFQSQDVKNHLLNAVDGLQWAAVNCSGGHCQILVKERQNAPELLNRKLPCDIIAEKSGTITAISVLEGQPACAVGDTVDAGDVLVTGINDFAVNLQKTHAQAEIYARTWHDYRAVTPAAYTHSQKTGETSTAYYLQIGRFRIKICGNSSNLTSGCDKILERNKLALPGGPSFPLVLIRETVYIGEAVPAAMMEADGEALLLQHCRSRISASMTAGRILSETSTTVSKDTWIGIRSVFACEEMIAGEREVNLFGSEQFYGRENSERGTH